MATECVFRNEGVKFRVVSDPASFDSKGKFVCYSGGGNRSDITARPDTFCKSTMNRQRAWSFSLTPLKATKTLLAEFSSRVTIICRDPVSYAHCRAAASKAEILASDDLALCLNPRDLSGWKVVTAALAEPVVYATLQRAYSDFVLEYRGKNDLTVLRGDCERHPSRKEQPMRPVVHIRSE